MKSLLWMVLLCGLGCAPETEARPEDGVCFGAAEPINSALGPPVWKGVELDDDRNVLVYEEWSDERRAQPILRQESTYTDTGRLQSRQTTYAAENVSDLQEVWIRGQRGLLETYQRSTLDTDRLLFQRDFRHDEDGRVLLTEADRDGDGVVDEVEHWLRTDGRLIAWELRDAVDQSLSQRWSREYFRPAPDLDHVEYVDEDGDGEAETVLTRSYTAGGEALLVEGERGEARWVEEYLWKEGRLVSSFLSPDRRFDEDFPDIIYLGTWEYREDGLLLQQIDLWDVDNSGESEIVDYENWQWFGCDR